MPTTALHACDGAVDACGDHATVTGAHGLTLLRAGPAHAQLVFDTIEVLDVEQQPTGVLRGALGSLMQLVPGVCPA